VSEFVALAAALRAPAASTAPSASSPAAEPPQLETLACDGALEELARARLAALEAYERGVPRLLEALARDVLGRELLLAPADLTRIAAAARERFGAEEPVALWLSPADAACVAVDLPVRTDPALEPGDLVLEVRDGELDARFSLRLADAVRGVLDLVDEA
jgi:flagellar biosynthesis/type III secretory pathway protein FliH